MMVVEHDVKFVQAYPLKDYTAVTAASKLFKHYCTFGSYDAIYSDPGSAFLSDVVKQLNNWFGIEHRVSLVGRHESNGTEHSNGLLIGHLRRLVHDERIASEWDSDEVLPLVNHALNYYPNSELGGLSPLELKFGSTNYQRFHLPELLPVGQDYHEYLNKLNSNMSIIRDISTKYQSDLRNSRLTDSHLQNRYQPGDLILFNPRENPYAMRETKLSPKFLGPYEVISQRRNDIKCKHVTLNTEHVLHASRVHPFFGTVDDAKRVSMVDREEFLVEEILAHRGNSNRKASMEFLVRWHGYSDQDNTWEPWNNLKDNSFLHEYLKKNNMSNLIPASHK
jgi:hypothetical protein